MLSLASPNGLGMLQRISVSPVRIDGSWQLLDRPSLYRMHSSSDT